MSQVRVQRSQVNVAVHASNAAATFRAECQLDGQKVTGKAEAQLDGVGVAEEVLQHCAQQRSRFRCASEGLRVLQGTKRNLHNAGKGRGASVQLALTHTTQTMRMATHEHAHETEVRGGRTRRNTASAASSVRHASCSSAAGARRSPGFHLRLCIVLGVAASAASSKSVCLRGSERGDTQQRQCHRMSRVPGSLAAQHGHVCAGSARSALGVEATEVTAQHWFPASSRVFVLSSSSRSGEVPCSTTSILQGRVH